MNRNSLFTTSTKALMTLAATTAMTSAFTAHAQPPQPPQYKLTDLGPSGNPFSQAAGVADNGLVAGSDVVTSDPGAGNIHSILWYKGRPFDINASLGGPNSAAGGVNLLDQVLGQAETSTKDPNNENFCGFFTGLQCLPYVWQFGVITALPTLGGANASFGAINNLGAVSGFAENNHRDPDCRPGVAINGTGPQVLDFEPVIWGPKPGQIRQLELLPGDTVGMALGLNDLGQAVGTTGTCANTLIPGFAAGPHAVLWDIDGSVHDLGNLGGTVNNTLLGSGTVAFVINNQGQVAGQSDQPGDNAFHPFLWTRQTGMRDLGVLPGDLVGASLGLNNLGDIVGASVTAPGPASGNSRAFLWHKGKMSDLNALIPANSSMHLLAAFSINDEGQIAGFGKVTSGPDAGKFHGFLATPKY
jgi:probable HAF family extracellular repeat protein